MAVKVQFEIGHTSRLRSKKTPHPQAFTHDWEIYVKGVNQADISNFVDKVVFQLHESFPKPKRVFKEPPYAIQESGYAGFLLPVEIFFRNRDEPKRIMYQYDLVLQSTGPPQHHVQVKTHIFEAPSEEFRAKLMRGGGVPVFGANIGASSISRTLSPSVGSAGEAAPNNEIGIVKAKGGANTISMNVDLGAGKKHKSRPEDPGKSNAFSALFGPPITKGSTTGSSQSLGPVSKHSPDAKSASVSSKSGSHDGKEKSSKERDKSSSGDKPREKDKKDRHGRDKDRKSSKSGEGKHERDKDKSKKDKTRDKDREREQSSGSASASGALAAATTSLPAVSAAGGLVKRTSSPKPGKPAEMSAPSPKKGAASDQSTAAAVPTSRSKERDEHKSSKTESKDKERSSSKKSKKDKKDKDKERDREKQRDEHKDKRLPKEERAGQSDSPAVGIPQHSAQHQSQAGATGKATPTSVGSNSSSSMASTTGKHREESIGKHGEKTADPKTTDKGTSNGSTTADTKKSHKHKKKDKSKDKDKERSDRDKDKDKERDKEKSKEREKDKQPAAASSEKPSTAEPLPKTEGASPATEGGVSDKTASSANSSSSSKKDKHKKSKEKSSGKDEKRQREVGDKQPEPKNAGKQVQQGHPLSAQQNKAPRNLDLSDVDSAQSAPDLAATSALTAASVGAATLQHSDSSNSSFPDLPAKGSNQVKPAKGNAGTGKEAKPSGKEHKAKSKQSDKSTDKTEKPNKTPDAKSDKSEKPDKDEKKRIRRSSQNSNSGSGGGGGGGGGGGSGGFIEPPVKASKKEQSKTQREKSKSPSLRPSRETNSTGGTNNTGLGFLPPPPSSSPSNNHIGCTTPASLSNNNNNTNSNNAHSPADLTVPGQLQLPTEYLSELQELHHKIMTLQDNEELQHVVEMIAATGCYEITHKTFDFDLCKLDRVTVQRLQEFLATSVS
ncbi:hypothetical protein KR032_006831 [Drosophila birchii]|nr:hypothetical protein KR032_006831 [Drosophila birchii]